MSVSKQQVFDRVAVHLLTQKRKAINADQDCQYRAPDGSKCALGCLIPDRVYKAEMEGRHISDLVTAFEPVLPKYFGKHYGLLRDLQHVHDDFEPAQWRAALSKLAEDYDLKRSVLSRFRA